MANGIDANLILQGLQGISAENRPVSNLLAGLQAQQALQSNLLGQQATRQQLSQQQAAAPLQQQLLEQRVEAGQAGIDLAATKEERAQFAQTLKTLGQAAKTLKPFIESGDLIGAASQIDSLEGLGFPQESLQEIDNLIASGNIDEINQQIATIENLNKANLGEGEIIKSSQRLVNIDGKQFSEVDVAQADGTFETIRTPVGGVVARKATGETIKQQREAEVTQKGAERAAVLEQELKTAPTVEASKEAATQAIKESGKAFERLASVNQGITNIDEGIRLIDEGADTGVIVGRLPSISKSSIELDNLQKRLGLDVVGNTTFGALSESELKFALDSALPQNLSPPDLRRWLVRKKESQQKLSDYLSDAASFLGTPGNTIADFVQLQKVRELESEQDQLVQPDQQRARRRGGPLGGVGAITLPNGVVVRRVGG